MTAGTGSQVTGSPQRMLAIFIFGSEPLSPASSQLPGAALLSYSPRSVWFGFSYHGYVTLHWDSLCFSLFLVGYVWRDGIWMKFWGCFCLPGCIVGWSVEITP